MTPQPQNQAKAGANPEWLLIVDDDQPICEMITNALESHAMDVVSAHSAQAALHEIETRATEPLVVLVDVLMPGMDGLTLARKLGPRLPGSKIIVMSGHLTNESWWPVDLREVTFLPKPFRMAELEELIQSARTDSAGKT